MLSAAAVVLAAGAAVFRPWHASQSVPALAAASSVVSPAAVPARSAAGRPALADVDAGARSPNRPERAVIYVVGQVVRPGVYALPASARVLDALRAAGGPAGDADLVAVNLAERVADGEEIVVQPKGASDALGSATRSPTGESRRTGRHRRQTQNARHRRSSRSHKAPPAETVDLNHADESTLEELPGVGPALAERIVAFRELNGPFASLTDLLDVNGMSDSRLEEISPYATVR